MSIYGFIQNQKGKFRQQQEKVRNSTVGTTAERKAHLKAESLRLKKEAKQQTEIQQYKTEIKKAKAKSGRGFQGSLNKMRSFSANVKKKQDEGIKRFGGTSSPSPFTVDGKSNSKSPFTVDGRAGNSPFSITSNKPKPRAKRKKSKTVIIKL